MTMTHISQNTSKSAAPISAETAILVTVLTLIGLVALATATWGLPALAMSAVAMVPVVMTCLVLITVGK